MIQERLAKILCDRYGPMIHNQALGWDESDEGTKAIWRDEAKLVLRDYEEEDK